MPKEQRMCIACRERKDQKDMLRVARVNQEYVVDKTNKLGGRGAYICKCEPCLQLVVKKRILNRAFKTDVGLDIYSALGDYGKNN